MEREIKGTVLSWLRQEGFKGAFPHFRRPGQSAIDLLTFQFDQHGGGYVIEIAQCPADGIVTHWGRTISAGEAKAWDVHPSRRKRICADNRPGTDGWFRFDRTSPEQLAALTIAKLSDANIWLQLGSLGTSDKLHLPR
jgi:hypothetical protein